LRFKARLTLLQLTFPGPLSIRPGYEHASAPPPSSRMTRWRGANRSGCASDSVHLPEPNQMKQAETRSRAASTRRLPIPARAV
ncbi:MAG: hypothetical protein MUE84_02415, partial [Hyphomonas sp.]|nr:hypothetical protein [Hyphomonas sp.]